ncbi:hypothetical protein, partial [uncultured Methylobacterium sp.]|uniref:hypothetical protein n=1 Tax=uncultured Methylobacterium sp. TaxID=157278 RepID=UPI002598D19E
MNRVSAGRGRVGQDVMASSRSQAVPHSLQAGSVSNRSRAAWVEHRIYLTGTRREAIAGIAPFLWFLLTLRGSDGQNHAALQEFEAGPSIALALDELEPV